MRTLAAIAFSFSAALALLCYLPEGAWAFWAAAGLAVLGGAALLLPALGKNKRLRLTLVLIALSLAAGLLYGRGWRHFIADPVREKCGGSHLFSATVCDWPQETDSGWRVTVRLTDARGAKAVCYLSGDAADLEPGQMLLGEAYWQDASVIKGTEITTFTARGVFALLYCNTFPDVSPGSAGSVRYLPQHLARAMRDTISRVWPDETAAAILRAELLGDRSGIDTALSSRFSEAGVSHLFAVSGLHCAFLLTLLSLLVGPQRRRLLAAVGIAVLTVYMLMVGLTPSVVRACIMQFFLLLAPLFLRDADPPTSLASALLVILLWNPYAAQSVSLQLSFGAMLGLILVTPRVHGFFAGRIRPRKKPVRAAVSFLLSTLCSTLGAMVFTVPLTAYYFGVFSTVAPLTSLLCIPLASWNFMAGFLTALLGFVFLPAARTGVCLPGTDQALFMGGGPGLRHPLPRSLHGHQSLSCVVAGVCIRRLSPVHFQPGARAKIRLCGGGFRSHSGSVHHPAHRRISQRHPDGGGCGCGPGSQHPAPVRRGHDPGGLRQQQPL